MDTIFLDDCGPFSQFNATSHQTKMVEEWFRGYNKGQSTETHIFQIIELPANVLVSFTTSHL